MGSVGGSGKEKGKGGGERRGAMRDIRGEEDSKSAEQKGWFGEWGGFWGRGWEDGG